MNENKRADTVAQLIQLSNNIAVIPSTEGGIDAFSAGVGLFQMIKAKGKQVSFIYNSQIPEHGHDLINKDEILNNVTERDLIVSVNYSGTTASKMNYEVEDDVLKFRIGPVAKNFNFDRIKSELVGHDYDLIFTVGIQAVTDTGDLYSELSKNFASGHVVNLDNNNKNTRYGKSNLIDSSKKSLSLLMLDTLYKWGLRLDTEPAKSLLTGITYSGS